MNHTPCSAEPLKVAPPLPQDPQLSTELSRAEEEDFLDGLIG
jgi:hypothetical protein